jgi:hypothetical protein
LSDTIDTRDEKGKDPSKLAFVREWLEAIDLAGDEEKDWRDDAEKAVKLFRGTERTGGRQFNILHANTETLIPALYNSIPVPDVRRRWNDGRALANPQNPQEKQQAEASSKVAKDVADTIERGLSYLVDQYDFDGLMQSGVRDMALPGRGVARIRLREDETEDGGDVGYQSVTCEHVPWAQFRRGPGKVWPDVPWVAFCHYLSRKQLKRLAGEKVGKEVQLDALVRKKDEVKPDGPVPDLYGRAEVWEIWDKEARKVIFIARSYAEGPLAEVEDPLSLEGFFPCPRPMYAIASPDTLCPVTPYEVYRDLAEELNLVTRRIAKIIAQLKVKGGYAAAGNLAADLKSLESADDGEFIPFSGVEQFLSGGGLEKAIMFWPLEPAVKALAQLYLQRDQIKQTIYEVTGIADILRGQTDPDETLGAQQIKAQWGSLRIQRMQAEVARFARDLFRMKAELIATRFTPQNLEMMTGVRLDEQGQAMLQNDALRTYRIDIESDSTIRADMTRSQEQMNLFIGATAQFATAAAGVIPLAPQVLPAAVEVYTSFARKFKLGKQAEDALDSLSQVAAQQTGENAPPSPEEIKAQADQQKMQMEMQAMQAKAELDSQAMQMKVEADQQKAQADIAMQQQQHEMKLREMEMGLQIKQAEMALKEREMEMREREMGMKAELAEREATIKSATMEREAVFGAQATEHKHRVDMEMMDAKAKQAKAANSNDKASESKPKSWRVLRDPKTNRVTGAEAVH